MIFVLVSIDKVTDELSLLVENKISSQMKKKKKKQDQRDIILDYMGIGYVPCLRFFFFYYVNGEVLSLFFLSFFLSFFLYSTPKNPWRSTVIALFDLYLEFHTFPKSISMKVNVTAQVRFELVYYNIAAQPFNHDTSDSPPLVSFFLYLLQSNVRCLLLSNSFLAPPD